MSVNSEYIENGFLRVDGSGGRLGDGRATRIQSSNTLKFQSMPAELGTSKSADFTPVQIIGRANPLWIYSSSGERAWNLELKFFVTETAAGLRDTPSILDQTESGAGLGSAPNIAAQNNEVREQVADKINWCEALVYPVVKNGLSQGPPTVMFVFGDLINVNCICTDAQSSYAGPWFVKGPGQLGWPMFGTVNLTLKQIGGGSLSYQDVRANLHQSPRSL